MYKQKLNIAERYPVNGYTGKASSDRTSGLYNQLAVVQVLDRYDNISKILVNGAVFQSSLPVNVGVGETLLAKITGTHPVVLQLDKLYGDDELTEVNLSKLSERMASKSTKTSNALLRELIRNNEVILKSKYTKLLKLLEGGGINIEKPGNEILPVLFWDAENFYSLTEENIKYFKHQVNELQKMIFDVINANAKLPVAELNRLREALTVSDNNAKATAIEHHKKLASVDSFFINWLEENSGGGKEAVKALSSILLVYLFQKKFYKRKNIFPEFFIMNNNGVPELVEYQVKKKISGNISEMFVVDFNFSQKDTENLGAEIILNGQSSNIHLPDMLIGNSNLHYLLKELPADIKMKYNLPVKVVFKSAMQMQKNEFFGSVNAAV